LMNVDGTGQTSLTASTADDERPAWSSTGDWIAFVSRRDGNRDDI